MKIYFEDLTQAALEYDLSRTAFDAARAELDDIMEAARLRIADKKADSARRKRELQKIIDGEARETTKKLALAEMQQIEQEAFQTTDTENESFSDALDRAKESMAEMDRASIAFKKSYDSVQLQLAKMRNDILADTSKDIRPRWIESAAQAFERLR